MLEEITSEKLIYIMVSDVSSAFWQVRLKETSRDLTSFTAPDGRRWRFTRCPFGLNNSSSGLQNTLGTLFSNKSRFKNLLVYMDDICIHSNTWKNHLDQLEQALQVLLESKISLSPRKTEVAAHEVEYLGHRICGLNNSPSGLQNTLGTLFSNKSRFKNLLVYMDDICIHSNTWKNHLEQLEQALQVLLESKISLSPRKTEVAAHELEYLGHRICGESVRMTEKHIEAIKKMQAPKM